MTDTTSQLSLFKYLSHIHFGTCKFKDDEKIILTVGCREIDVSNITDEDIEWLNQHLEVAYFSENNEKKVDTNVRNSKYTKAFNLNIDVNRIIGSSRVAKPYKLNLYKGGNFFSTHRDTNRPGLVGTLILILPTDYTGGELCFGDFNAEAYQKQHDENARSKNIRFIFFDSEIEHSVSEVTSGNRITLVYNVFENEIFTNYYIPEVCPTKTPEDWMDEVIKYAFEFCEGKKNILFGSFKSQSYKVFETVLKALEDKFKVVKVAVENDSDTYRRETKDLSDFTEVHVIEADDCRSVSSSGICFEGIIEQTYKVEHFLLPSHSEWENETRGYVRKHGYRGNSPCRSDVDIEVYTGYLINPYVPEKQNNDGDTH